MFQQTHLPRTARTRLPRSSRTKGGILAMTLAVLVVMLLFVAGVTRALVLHHRQERQMEQRQQAMWLADSALQRAHAALAKDAKYVGETWRVPSEVLGGDHTGVAIIRVEPQTEPRAGSRVHVEAQFPDQGVHRFSYERETFVDQSGPGGTL